jgi:hypothetical protein
MASPNAGLDSHMSKESENGATNPATQDYASNAVNSSGHRYNYGGNPLAHLNTGDSARFPAFGGEFQPGLYKPTTGRKFANPAPLGLSAFALTTFVLSLINVQARGVTEPNIVVALAYGYGGLVQLLAGMWYVIAHLLARICAYCFLQGDGCRKYLRCHGTFFVWWLLDLFWYRLDAWWFQHRGRIQYHW